LIPVNAMPSAGADIADTNDGASSRDFSGRMPKNSSASAIVFNRVSLRMMLSDYRLAARLADRANFATNIEMNVGAYVVTEIEFSNAFSRDAELAGTIGILQR